MVLNLHYSMMMGLNIVAGVKACIILHTEMWLILNTSRFVEICQETSSHLQLAPCFSSPKHTLELMKYSIKLRYGKLSIKEISANAHWMSVEKDYETF